MSKALVLSAVGKTPNLLLSASTTCSIVSAGWPRILLNWRIGRL